MQWTRMRIVRLQGGGATAGSDLRVFSRRLLSNQEDHELFGWPSEKLNVMRDEEMGLKC